MKPETGTSFFNRVFAVWAILVTSPLKVLGGSKVSDVDIMSQQPNDPFDRLAESVREVRSQQAGRRGLQEISMNGFGYKFVGVTNFANSISGPDVALNVTSPGGAFELVRIPGARSTGSQIPVTMEVVDSSQGQVIVQYLTNLAGSVTLNQAIQALSLNGTKVTNLPIVINNNQTVTPLLLTDIFTPPSSVDAINSSNIAVVTVNNGGDVAINLAGKSIILENNHNGTFRVDPVLAAAPTAAPVLSPSQQAPTPSPVGSPTTSNPTTNIPTTANPTSAAPSTLNPSTASAAPSTLNPSTESPVATSAAPSSQNPTSNPATNSPEESKSPTIVPTAPPISATPSPATRVPTPRSTLPTDAPGTGTPMWTPTTNPVTGQPTWTPTFSPSANPASNAPSPSPVSNPTNSPESKSPVDAPSSFPTRSPFSEAPITLSPVILSPTFNPTASPVLMLTPSPSNNPTQEPTSVPTIEPTQAPVHIANITVNGMHCSIFGCGNMTMVGVKDGNQIQYVIFDNNNVVAIDQNSLPKISGNIRSANCTEKGIDIDTSAGTYEIELNATENDEGTCVVNSTGYEFSTHSPTPSPTGSPTTPIKALGNEAGLSDSEWGGVVAGAVIGMGLVIMGAICCWCCKEKKDKDIAQDLFAKSIANSAADRAARTYAANPNLKDLYEVVYNTTMANMAFFYKEPVLVGLAADAAADAANTVLVAARDLPSATATASAAAAAITTGLTVNINHAANIGNGVRIAAIGPVGAALSNGELVVHILANGNFTGPVAVAALGPVPHAHALPAIVSAYVASMNAYNAHGKPYVSAIAGVHASRGCTVNNRTVPAALDGAAEKARQLPSNIIKITDITPLAVHQKGVSVAA
ncbi:MAG: hypothetical protein K0R25_780 [Rickettsiaceae bacterium]|nr:hypothetical protein [Rickettsiaceae bacterium]